MRRDRRRLARRRGEPEIDFQQVSELLPIQGIDYAGPLPAEVQKVTLFSADIAAHVGEPEAVLEKMNKALDAAMKSPEIAERLAKQGIEPIGGARASFVQFITAERSRLGAVAKAAGMKDE